MKRGNEENALEGVTLWALQEAEEVLEVLDQDQGSAYLEEMDKEDRVVLTCAILQSSTIQRLANAVKELAEAVYANHV